MLLGGSSALTIYNASAGSGKTFALVQAYLVKIISQRHPDYYKHLLAITFTNKAVAEMKIRIIEALVGFSKEEITPSVKDLFLLVKEGTGLPQEEVQLRSRTILKHLLHHYAQFSVETIDHFNHRLIRTFARDLNLSGSFEVSLDVPQLISQAVDQLIEKAGEEPGITKILLDFALQKTDEDKSWDIAIDLRKTAVLLANENDAGHLEKLKDKSLQDFRLLQERIKKQASSLEASIKTLAHTMLQKFHEKNLDRSHFSRGYLYDFFSKVASGDFAVNYHTAWQRDLGEKPLYPARIDDTLARIIDALVPDITGCFQQIKKKVYSYFLLENIRKNLVPLATVHLVNKELQLIKESENIVPINEFNSLIHEEIKDQPAPFIYERLGDRYRNFFIDEFQDTSLLQWNNLIPLIENAVSQEYEGENKGSLLLVGDAKQSIYRWRGGLPEQFIELYESKTPFAISEEKRVVNLDTNYRSCEEIITFNNEFFSFISNFFGNPTHRELYAIGNRQKHTSRKGGYVKIEFREDTKSVATAADQVADSYASKVHKTIADALTQGYRKKDICILTRKKKEGIEISEYLLENEIPVLSDETLLLKNAPIVQFLIHILSLGIAPQNQEVKIEFLDFLYDHFSFSEDKDSFFKSLLNEPLESISEKLKAQSIDFSFEALQHRSLFEGFEYSIEALQLAQNADTFVTSFMDLVFRFSQRPFSGKTAFLEYWELEMERAAISANPNTDAIKVMTIHKAKGLEFPVVIFPYADLDIYSEKEAKAWYPYGEGGFEALLINYKNEVAEYNETGAAMASERRNTLELDNINLLYVALTRAETQLYIFATNKTPKSPPVTYNGFLKTFLIETGRWADEEMVYEFGTAIPFAPEIKESRKITEVEVPYFVSIPENRQIKLVTSETAEITLESARAINIGNLLHSAMALVRHSEDLEPTLTDLERQLANEPDTYSEVKQMMTRIVEHPELSQLFTGTETVMNEREILTPDRTLRPDRINFHEDQTVTLVDYKTGMPKEAHEHQIGSYAAALQDMGFKLREKLLLYCDDDTILINKS